MTSISIQQTTRHPKHSSINTTTQIIITRFQMKKYIILIQNYRLIKNVIVQKEN